MSGIEQRTLSPRGFALSGSKYGALAGFTCAELFIIGPVGFALLGQVFGRDAPLMPDLAVALFLIGQFIGVLPATILGALLGLLGGLLFRRYSATINRGAAIWGALYALGMYLLITGIPWLLFGIRLDLFSLVWDSMNRQAITDDEFLHSYAIVFLLYLCAGAWGGVRMNRLAAKYN